MPTSLVSIAVLLLTVITQSPVRTAAPDAAVPAERQDERGRRLLDIAIGTEGVLGADLALKLLETGRIGNDELRREAREFARSRVSMADDPFQVTMMPYDGYGARELETCMALEIYPVDALSLRCRLALQCLDADPQMARELVLGLEPGLEAPASGCGEALVPNVDVFYRTLPQILSTTLTAEEIRGGMKWEIARRYVDGVSHCSAIAPAAGFIQAIGAPQAVVDQLAVGLAGAVSRLEGSPRALFVAVTSRSWQPVGLLLEGLADGPRKALGGELRKFVVRSLTVPRCADLPAETYPKELLDYVNDTVFADRPIAPDSSATRPPRGEAAVHTPIWVSPQSARYLYEFQVFNWERKQAAHNGKELTAEWKLRYLEYASKLRNWNSLGSGDDYDYLVEKGSIILGMLENAPDEESQLEVLKDFASLVRHANRAKVPPYVLLGHVAVALSRLNEVRRNLALEMFRTGQGHVAAYAELQLEGVDAFGITDGTKQAP
ncbi:MAG: hypothetical protein IT175_01945 [Acidobacteria bacterium]|nr:hypothetical protein [Acidobacteriota bacterium]